MRKRRIIRWSIALIIALGVFIVLYNIEQQHKNTDAYKFKVEYESVNNETSKSGKNYRKLDIPSDNRMKYSTTKEIVEKINKKESFIVYFGFATCPWCRSMINNLIDLSNEHNQDIYYVDVKDIRDTLELKNGEITTSKTGEKYYMELIDKLGSVLNDYNITDEEGNTIKTGEKRIYAPNVVAVVNGEPQKMAEGISEDMEDPYGKITDKMKNDSIEQLKCIFKCFEEANVCTKAKEC